MGHEPETISWVAIAMSKVDEGDVYLESAISSGFTHNAKEIPFENTDVNIPGVRSFIAGM